MTRPEVAPPPSPLPASPSSSAVSSALPRGAIAIDHASFKWGSPQSMKEHEKREDRVPTAPTLQGMEFSRLSPSYFLHRAFCSLPPSFLPLEPLYLSANQTIQTPKCPKSNHPTTLSLTFTPSPPSSLPLSRRDSLCPSWQLALRVRSNGGGEDLSSPFPAGRDPSALGPGFPSRTSGLCCAER